MVFEIRDLWPLVPIALGAIKNPLLTWAAKALEKYAYRHSSRIVALAPGMRTEVLRHGYPPKRIAVVPNGADIELFQQIPNSDLRIEHEWLTAAQLIVYAGTIGPANGVSYIPKLAAAILEFDNDSAIRFAVIGEGKLLDTVKNEARQLGVLDKNVFFIGNIPKATVPKWFQHAIATIMTYDGPAVLYRDSVSNKFFDSLAAGKPVIANYSGFSTMIAAANDAGIILPKDNLRAAASALSVWINNQTEMKIRSHNAFSLATKLFDRSKLSRDFARVITEAVHTPNIARCDKIGSHFSKMWHDCTRRAETGVAAVPAGGYPSTHG